MGLRLPSHRRKFSSWPCADSSAWGLFIKYKMRYEIFIKTLTSGIDFLGWVHFPDHRVWRTETKKRMIRRLKNHKSPETINSYLGLLKWGNTHKICRGIIDSLA